jgi:hypothetical protein
LISVTVGDLRDPAQLGTEMKRFIFQRDRRRVAKSRSKSAHGNIPEVMWAALLTKDEMSSWLGQSGYFPGRQRGTEKDLGVRWSDVASDSV